MDTSTKTTVATTMSMDIKTLEAEMLDLTVEEEDVDEPVHGLAIVVL